MKHLVIHGLSTEDINKIIDAIDLLKGVRFWPYHKEVLKPQLLKNKNTIRRLK